MSKADPYEKARRSFVAAAVATVVGIAVAGTLDKTAGGVVLVAAWLATIAALHRLGRAGADEP